jgi:hypothetical protein
MTVARAVELQEQSWTLEAEGKLDEASCACREALRLMECAEGRDSPDVANLLNDLAEIEQERQNFAEALALAMRWMTRWAYSAMSCSCVTSTIVFPC